MKDSSMFKMYVVEDDAQIRSELTVLLTRNGYEVIACESFDAVTENIIACDVDIVLLDLNLPVFDGHVICRELREQSEVPIIVVTSRDSDLDELMSMNLGADDFVTKPYVPQILLARIANVLKRSYQTASNEVYSYKGVELNPGKSMVTFLGKSAELTKNEMRILQLLMLHAEEIVSRDDIRLELWHSDEFVDDNTLTVNINRLRSTLTEIGLDDILHTKRGLGYSMQK